MRTHPKFGVYVPGLTETAVTTSEKSAQIDSGLSLLGQLCLALLDLYFLSARVLLILDKKFIPRLDRRRLQR